MAQYEHLQIYRDAFQYLIYCETIVKNFPRYHKYTHGTDLRNNARMNVKLIIRANNLQIKSPVLEELRLSLEESKLLIRICKEVKAFQNFNSFETAINQVTNISRQAEGWLKSCRKQENDLNRKSSEKSGEI